jgi:protein-disulfide isomerase/uncharacterized membrane protein
MTNQRLSRLFLAGVVLCVAGVVLSAVISNVHAKIAALGNQYTSFCNVNESVNCDAVLSSPYAKMFGIPVAWLAVLAYAVTAGLLLAAWRATGTSKAAWTAAAGACIAGSVVFSLYMAGISLFVLNTVCLLCSGLYAITLGLLAVAVLIVPSWRSTGEGRARLISYRNFVLAAGVSAAAVASLAWANWPAVGTLSTGLVSLDDIRRADREFYAWYLEHPVVTVPAGQRNVFGDPAATVTIVEFSDLQCGHCKRNHEKLKSLLDRRPGDVRVVYRHFPLDVRCNDVVGKTIHPYACRAAEAAECAGLQGRFEAMVDILFANQQQLFEANLSRLAAKIGLDGDAFAECMQEGTTLPNVIDDARAGTAMNINSTPTLYINGREIRGSFEHDVSYDYAVLIEAILAQGGARPH